jgi:hypothetical protein
VAQSSVSLRHQPVATHSVNGAVNDNPADQCQAVPINVRPEQVKRGRKRTERSR